MEGPVSSNRLAPPTRHTATLCCGGGVEDEGWSLPRRGEAARKSVGRRRSEEGKESAAARKRRSGASTAAMRRREAAGGGRAPRPRSCRASSSWPAPRRASPSSLRARLVTLSAAGGVAVVAAHGVVVVKTMGARGRRRWL
uniref:Uncharacterized protein n=1 Tax=Arundo donax TaxID=35708 RepID=A0A0A9HUR6_ARUDO